MTQPVSAQQKISAIVLSGLLFASVVFAYQKQHPPTAIPFAHSTSDTPHLDAAQQAAQDAKPEVLDAALKAEIDAVARQHAQTRLQSTIRSECDEQTSQIGCTPRTGISQIEVAKPRVTPFNLSSRSEVHVVGVYEADDGETEPWWAGCGHTESESLVCFEEMKRKKSLGGSVEVIVDYPNQPIVLILTAYDPVEWNIKITARTKVEQLIIAGYSTQSYRGIPRSIPVATYTHQHSTCSTACWRGTGYFYAYDLLKEPSDLQQKIQEITGKKLYSFQGAYSGKSFNIYSGIPKLRY